MATRTFGVRNDSSLFLKHQKRFYEEVFFPFLKKNDIRTIIQVGDIFDRRKYINFQTLHEVHSFFFNKIKEYNLKLIVILGNHDVYYKNILDVNSPNLLLKNIPNITVVDKPGSYKFDTEWIDLYPWICDQNMNDSLDLIQNKKGDVAIGHFEISGFQMDSGFVCTEGMDKKFLEKYDMVISGHFHHRSNDGHIYYVGTPYEMTWACYDDPKGFHVFETASKDLTFIRNPNIIFHKFYYQDETDEQKKDLKDKIKKGFFKKYKDCFVKMAVVKKTNLNLYDSVLHELFNNCDIGDLTIVEDFTNPVEKIDDKHLDQMDDTLTILNKHVDALTLPVEINSNTLNKYLHAIYTDAVLNKTQEKE